MHDLCHRRRVLDVFADLPNCSVDVLLPGVTVCVLTLVSLQPGTIGDTLLLTRLEKDSSPVTIHIPTAHSKVRGRVDGAPG